MKYGKYRTNSFIPLNKIRLSKPIFMKLRRARQRSAQNVCTQFHGNPTNGSVADSWSEKGSVCRLHCLCQTSKTVPKARNGAPQQDRCLVFSGPLLRTVAKMRNARSPVYMDHDSLWLRVIQRQTQWVILLNASYEK
jgi:hypothetical protein